MRNHKIYIMMQVVSMIYPHVLRKHINQSPLSPRGGQTPSPQ